MTDDAFLDATAEAELVRTGAVKPTELVERAISRIQALNPRLNAVVIPLFEKGLREAAGAPANAPFRGVPYLMKDLTLISEGDPACQSIAGVRASGYVGTYDSHYLRRMRAAGFALVGKTNTPQMGLGATVEPECWGPTRNPWDTERSTGGSSGGSAAAVASGMVAVAHANDGGGSIRYPASHCGVIGMKGSRGRVSAGPRVNASDDLLGMTSECCVARSVRDVAAVLDVISGRHAGDAYGAPPQLRPYVQEVGADPGCLRIGLLDEDPTGTTSWHREPTAAVRLAASALRDLGHVVQPGFPEPLRADPWPAEFEPAVGVVVARELARWGRRIGRPLTEDDVEASTWALAATGQGVTGEQYAAAVDSIRRRAQEVESWWDEGWDLLLTPTTVDVPQPLGRVAGDEALIGEVNTLLSLLTPFNVSGQPAISLPLHWTTDRLPVGVHLVAAYGREDLLLRVASQLEQLIPWGDVKPPVSA